MCVPSLERQTSREAIIHAALLEADMDPHATLPEMAAVCGFGDACIMSWALAVRLQTRCTCCGKPGHDDKGCVSNRDNPLKEEILRKLPPGVRATVMKMRQLPPSQVMEAMNKIRDARRAERETSLEVRIG